MKLTYESGSLRVVSTSYWMASIRKEIQSDFARCVPYLVAVEPKARGHILNVATFQMWWEAGHQAATCLRYTYNMNKAGTVDVSNFRRTHNQNMEAVEKLLSPIIVEKMKAEAHRFYLRQSANLKFSRRDLSAFFRCSDFEAESLIKYLSDKELVSEIEPGTFQVNEGCLEISGDGYGRQSLCDSVCGQFAKGFPNKDEAFDSFELLLEVEKDMEVLLKHLDVKVEGKEAGTCNLRKYFRALENSSKERAAKTGEDTSDNVAFSLWFAQKDSFLSTNDWLELICRNPHLPLHYPRTFSYFLDATAFEDLRGLVAKIKGELATDLGAVDPDKISNDANAYQISLLVNLL